MLTAAGIGSGLDVESIVSQLMKIEQQPLVALQQKQKDLDADLSAFGKLKSTLSTFQTAMKDLSSPAALKVFTATSGNDSVFTASATNTAAASSFDIEVVRLAERHKLASAELLDTDTIGGKANDALTIQVGADPASILTVDLSAALTLSGIRDAINGAAGNPGVSASIIFGNDGKQKLILAADDSGASNALTLSFSGKKEIETTLGFQTVNDIGGDTSLLDAEVRVDGYSVTRGSNTIDDMISGITLDLHGAAPGEIYTLDIERDTEAVASSVHAFADAFNELRNTIKDLRANQLEADGSLLSIERRLFSVINTPASGLNSGLSYLTQVGVSFMKDGTMVVEEGDLKSALDNDFSAVQEVFATEGQGFANRLDTLVGGWLGTDGLLDIRTHSIEDQKRSLEDRQFSLEHRLSLIETRYRSQFTMLDTLMGNLQVTSDYLTNQLQNLPGFGA
jgi:flagellar hook-associated protein 2